MRRLIGAVGLLVFAHAPPRPFAADQSALEEACGQSCLASPCELVPQWDAKGCVDVAAESLVTQFDGLGDLVGFVSETSLVCAAAPSSKTAAWACRIGSRLALQLLGSGLHVLHRCLAPSEAQSAEQIVECGDEAVTSRLRAAELVSRAAEGQRTTPLSYWADKVSKVAERLRSGIRVDIDAAAPMAWQALAEAGRALADIVRWSIWHTNNWLWVTDILEGNGTIVAGEWGLVGRGEGGAFDAAVHVVDVNQAPLYEMAGPDLQGMRWDILIQLLRRLLATKRGLLGLSHGDEDPELLVAEVGVFAGHLSAMVLDALPSVKLFGVDPYIGSDNTFPGNFSKALDPDVALANAAETFAKYGEERARLLPVASKDAAAAFPDGALDAVFIDGCHLYNCVVEDLQAWLPKLRPGGLVTGHDFSPQWPGVVRAVHEARVGRTVSLGMDWMYWWIHDE